MPLHHVFEQAELAWQQIDRSVATLRRSIDEIKLRDPTRSIASSGSAGERTGDSMLESVSAIASSRLD
jgi:hypothetical protein